MTCNLRPGLNILIMWYRYGYEKEGAVSITNAQTVDEFVDYICDPMINALCVYFCFCDENSKEIRGANSHGGCTIEEYKRAYEWAVNGIKI